MLKNLIIAICITATVLMGYANYMFYTGQMYVKCVVDDTAYADD